MPWSRSAGTFAPNLCQLGLGGAGGDFPYLAGAADNGSKIVVGVYRNDGDPLSMADWVERDRAHNPAGAGVTSGKSAAVKVRSWRGRTFPFVVQWGHSLCMGFPFGTAYSAGYRLAADMGATLLDLSRGSSFAARDATSGGPPDNSGYAKVLQVVRSGSPMDDICYLIHLGIADAAFWAAGTPGVSFVTPFGHAIQTMLSRLVSDKVWEIGPGATDGDLTATWSGTWSSVTDTASNSGAGYRTSATDGSYVETTLPADWGGGTLAIGFVHLGAGNGASWTISLTGANSGTYTFDQLTTDADTGYKNGAVKRITGLNPGATTVQVTLSSHTSGGGGIDYLQHECDPAAAPEVLVVKQPHLSASGYAVLAGMIGHPVYESWIDSANAMLQAIVGSTFAAYPSVHLEDNGVHADEPGMITTLDNLHYSQAAFLSQSETLSRKAQRLLLRPADGQLHVLYTRSDQTGLFYGQMNVETGAWRPSAAVTVYSTSTPTMFDGCAVAGGSHLLAYAPSPATSVKSKMLAMFGLLGEATLSSGGETVTAIRAGQSPAGDRGHILWQESTTPAVRHRSVSAAGTDAAVLSVATDPHATYVSLTRPVGYLDASRQPQMMAGYTGTGPLHRAASFVSSAAPSFTLSTVTSSPVPGAVNAIQVAADADAGTFHAALVESSAGLWWNLYHDGAWGTATRVMSGAPVFPEAAAFRRPRSRSNAPLVLAVTYTDLADLTTRYGEWDPLAEVWPAVRSVPLVVIGERDYSAVATDLRWSDTDPGGFESFQARLPADSRVRKGDPVRVSLGGTVVWDGHVKDVEPLSAPAAALQVAGVGERSQLADSAMAELYVDRDMGQWTGLTAPRLAEWASTSYEGNDGQPYTSVVAGSYGLKLEVQGPWDAKMAVEADYDAGAWCRVGKIGVGLVERRTLTPPDANLASALTVSADVDGNPTIDLMTGLESDVNMEFLWSPSSPGRYASAIWSYAVAAPWILDAQLVGIYLRNLYVVGAHGLVLRRGPGSVGGQPGNTPTTVPGSLPGNARNDGFWPSDVVRDAIGRLNRSPRRVQPDGIVESPQFVVPHLAYREPTSVEQVVTDMANLLGWHWGVWEPAGFSDEPLFLFCPPQTQATVTCSVADFAEPPSIAESLDALYNRAVVTYRDGKGVQQSVTVERAVPELDDVGQVRTARYDLGISAAAVAENYGQLQLALADMAARGAGSGTLTYARSRDGRPVPAWAIRSGRDRIRIHDLPGRTRSPLDDVTRETFRVVRTETTVASDGTLASRIEFDSGANLADVLAARLDVAASAGTGGTGG